MADAGRSEAPLVGIDDVCRLLADARSCVLLVGAGLAAHHDTHAEAADPTRTGRLPGSGVGRLAACLAAAQRLVRVYTDDAYAAAIASAGAPGDDANSLDALTVRVGTRSTAADDDVSVARDAALADAHSPIDLLLVLGTTANASDEWAALTELLSEAADHIVVVVAGEAGDIPRSAALSGNTVAVRADEHVLTRAYIDHVSAIAGLDESTGCDTDCSAQRPQRGSRRAKGRGRDRPNLNHLLNFSLPVRLPVPPALIRPRRRGGETVVDERLAEVNRAVFINANFRFVLKPSHWTAFMAVARRVDMQLRAEWIERVVVPVVGASASCPICLSSPTAARITKCGHVFCLPCILRHLSYGDDDDDRSAKKCPVCWCTISSDALLPVHLWTVQYNANSAYQANGNLRPAFQDPSRPSARAAITMRLMRRRRGSTICLPRLSALRTCAGDAGAPSAAVDAAYFPWTFTDGALPFAKVLLAAKDYCADEYRRETGELLRARDEEEADSEPRLFVESALMSVEAALDASCAPSADWRRLEEQARATQLGPPCSGDGSHEEQVTPGSAGGGHALDDEEASNGSGGTYYSYQADDGQHIYMHPLHMRILAHDRGGYAEMPDSIEVNVRYSVESVITEEVRRRFRFLDHLSLRCEVVIIEPELRGVVSRASTDKFRHQLTHHDKQHAARARSVAIDEARSEMLAAAAAAAAQAADAAANGGLISFGAPAAASPAAGGDGAGPDIGNFPALGETTPSADGRPGSGHDSRPAPRRAEPMWPRQPAGGLGTGPLRGEVWAAFERAADNVHGGSYGSDHDDDRYDDPEDFSIPAKDPAAPTVAPQGSGKKKRGANKGLKLVLSGASARRSR